jgi:cob(I)alamin adenosyltransferase
MGVQMRITRVYTRTGDKGKTRLVGGDEVSKDSIRIDSYGTVDELNSVLGMARACLRDVQGEDEKLHLLDTRLQHVQNDLFDVGSDLATPPESRWPEMVRMGQADVARLEGWIDEANDELEPLQEFILPGGGHLPSTLHLARTVCRRAERRVVTLEQAEPETGTHCLIYLNRLSDLLFVWARWVGLALGETECAWVKASERSPSE